MSPAEILSRLIQFDTTSHLSNLELLDWVEAYLEPYGVHCRRIYDPTGQKANLIATIGNPDVPGYVLSGHVDVVPVDGQDWSFDPFGGEIRDGRVLGRGASDMKGFAACALAAVPRMVEAEMETPIHLCLSHDEEVGCIGVRSAIAELSKWPVRPKGCFVGEPTDMDVVLGHKAKRSVRAIVRGKAAHSSLAPAAVNAVEFAARLTVFISDIGRRLRESGPRDDLFDVPHTTAHVGLFNGGAQLNIVPEHAALDFEFRAVAADSPDLLVEEVVAYARRTLEPSMQAIAAGTGIDFEDISAIPGLETDADADIVTLAKSISRKNAHAKVAFGTEGGLFSEADIPTVIIGPGSIARAHKADEFIEVDELSACSDFLNGLIVHCQS